jgi:hypothetical protein
VAATLFVKALGTWLDNQSPHRETAHKCLAGMAEDKVLLPTLQFSRDQLYSRKQGGGGTIAIKTNGGF